MINIIFTWELIAIQGVTHSGFTLSTYLFYLESRIRMLKNILLMSAIFIKKNPAIKMEWSYL